VTAEVLDYVAIYGVHPLADVWPMLPDDQLSDLAESIAELGLLEGIVLDAEHRIIDGRNRLAACRLAGVDPWWVPVPGLESDEDIAAYISARNADRRHLTAGQQAMGRALMLQAQGKRRNGRWERGSVRNLTDGDSATELLIAKAGTVLDVAARAAVLGPQFAPETALPADVMAGVIRLDFAYKVAQQFDGKAAMAEAMKTQPLTEALTRLEVILDDADALLPLPPIEAPLTKAHRAQLAALTRRARDVAAAITTYAKESK
jgi:hypothetical protein